MDSNLFEALNFFLGFLFNSFSCFITARITSTSIIYLQYIYIINIIYTTSKTNMVSLEYKYEYFTYLQTFLYMALVKKNEVCPSWTYICT